MSDMQLGREMAHKIFKKFKPKKRPRNRDGASQDHVHWLGADIDAHETLISELDPILYAIDDVLHGRVNSAAHSYDGNEKRPCAIFLPIPETIGWQLGYISKEYNTYLLSAEQPEGYQGASDTFNIRFLDFDAFDRVDFWVDLFISTGYNWPSAHEFFTFMNANLPLLSPEGRAYAVLRGSASLTIDSDIDISLRWHDGSECSLGELLDCRWHSQAQPVVARSICLPSLDPLDPSKLSTFGKRNKLFFEKEASKLFLQAFAEDKDFSNLFELPESGDDAEWVVLLEWKSSASY